MIRICEKIHPKHPDWQLDIYGEGEQLQELEAKTSLIVIVRVQ